MPPDALTETPPESPAARGFADGYRAASENFDEMVEPAGALRPHWRMFVSQLDDLGPEERRQRWELAQRLIHDNGITHNVYGDESGLDRPWSLDFVPLLIDGAEWEALTRGLQQRARLLDRLLADLYGPSTTIAAGILPQELLHANPAFLRPCHGIRLPRDTYLHLYGADLVRTAGGSFVVLSDRTQAPSGAGYALENRIVLSQALPAIYRQCNVQRLAPFFLALRQTLVGLASAGRDNPRVVLLTPGPYNETYFEHAYLARYLGYMLVQGNDLTVRDSKVYLKTLSGLQRVDVILRRVDDDYCDPLELMAGSYLGIPGLVGAVRDGNVAVANALGSGVLQGPGFLPFLPALCRHLLDEELVLPSVNTWWCGEPAARQFVLERLERFVIKSAFPSRKADPIFAGALSAGERAALAERIATRPTEFVAQEPQLSATTPTLSGAAPAPQRFVLRTYLAAGADGYTLMPGGLTRTTQSPGSTIVGLQKGGASKDTWVLSDRPVSQISLLTPATQAVELSRGGGDLPSRVADDLYWLGRYVQRAESITRLGRAAIGRLIDQAAVESGRTVKILSVALLGRAHPAAATLDREIVNSLLNDEYPDSLTRALESVQRLARLLRDRISIDAWRILQVVERDVKAFTVNADDPAAGLAELLDHLVASFAAFSGLTADSMTRGQAWRFLDMGHRIERATAVTRLLRRTLIDGNDEMTLLEAVLEIADSSLTYRRRYLTALEKHAVVDLLLADDTNPRAVAFQVAAIESHLLALPREPGHPRRHRERQIARRLRSRLEECDAEALCRRDNRESPLGPFLQELLDQLVELSEALGQIYFAHTPGPRRLLSPGQGVS
jgi:uncharacterized circularly permuted ATP-grasp superfamily protein/uncharacterized alpha-E superfamily protein